MTELHYAGGNSIVELDGNAGQPFALQPGTAQGQRVTYTWSTGRERRVHDLECRIQVLAPEGSSALTSYQVLYQVEASAGESVFTEPRPKIFNLAAPNLVNDWVLPDRGTMFRVNARQLKLGFRLIAPIVSVNLMVSVQPCGAGSEVPQVPRVVLAQANTGLVSLPLSATRFRVRRSDGTAFAAAANTFTLYNLCGRSFGGVDCANYADWTPIPTPASFVRFNALDAIVEFQ